jgi:multiple sugar transport system permease protein
MDAEQVAGVQKSSRRRGISRKFRRTAWFYFFISPWLLGFVFLWIFPLVVGFLTSLTDYDGLNLANLNFVGLRNYARVFTGEDRDALFAFGQTLKWMALNLPAWMILSFILALILNQDVRGRGFFRTAYYIPSVIPVVALIWVWRIILDRNVGLLNALLNVFRPGTAVNWLTTYALPGLTIIAIWTGLGWGMVVFLAGLQGIPDELIEAARIDGASSLQIFRHITIPLMTPVIFFVLVNGLVSGFQQYVIPQLLNAGGNIAAAPPRQVYLILSHVNRQVFAFQRFGYGTALLWLLFFVIVAITFVLFRSSNYWVYSEAEAG